MAAPEDIKNANTANPEKKTSPTSSSKSNTEARTKPVKGTTKTTKETTPTETTKKTKTTKTTKTAKTTKTTKTTKKAKKAEKEKAKAKTKVKAGKDAEDTDDEEVEIVEEDLEEEEEEQEYFVKQKPELTPELKSGLRLRKQAKKKKPEFKRQEWFRYKRLGEAWRKPRGLQSKLRTNRKYRINRARIGYKTSDEVRGLHSSGFREILVYNKNDLDKIDPKLEAARIGHSVGTRKRIEIEEYADELGIRVLNRG